MKYIILFLSIFIIFSCSKNDNNPWIIKESSQIFDDYADSMEWSIKDAKGVKEIYNSWINDLNNKINEFTK